MRGFIGKLHFQKYVWTSNEYQLFKSLNGASSYIEFHMYCSTRLERIENGRLKDSSKGRIFHLSFPESNYINDTFKDYFVRRRRLVFRASFAKLEGLMALVV